MVTFWFSKRAGSIATARSGGAVALVADGGGTLLESSSISSSPGFGQRS